jgi:hypothetical protein
VEAMGQLHPSLGPEREVHLAVRLGIHTGLVVVGDVGGGPPARPRRPQHPGDQCRDVSAPRGVLCLPAVRHTSRERPGTAAGGLSCAL